jgi:hypothetical protein
MKNISYFSDLARQLRDYPDLAVVFGFHHLRLPQVENFLAFLGDTDNDILQDFILELLEFYSMCHFFWISHYLKTQTNCCSK